jgi:hypothetical protein
LCVILKCAAYLILSSIFHIYININVVVVDFVGWDLVIFMSFKVRVRLVLMNIIQLIAINGILSCIFHIYININVVVVVLVVLGFSYFYVN